MRDSRVKVFTIKDVDRIGIASVVDEALAIAGRGTAGVHVSFDLDVCDPAIAPGVGTPVKGGLDYREAHLLMEMVADCGLLRALDLVEVNPILDDRNMTAILGVELAASALGQKISEGLGIPVPATPLFPPHALRVAVLAQADERRVTQVVVAGPFQELELPHQHRLEPAAVRPFSRASVPCPQRPPLASGRFANGQVFDLERLEALHQLRADDRREAAARAGGVDQFVVLVVPEDQRIERRARRRCSRRSRTPGRG